MDYGALPSSACIHLQYDYRWQSSSMLIYVIYDADDNKVIGFARFTDHTTLQYNDSFWD